VAVCCSCPSRISRACAAIVFLSVAMGSREVETRRFTFFLGGFLIMLQNKTRLVIPVRVEMLHTEDRPGTANLKFRSSNPPIFSLVEPLPSRSNWNYLLLS
jgi:hypothetical protein